MWRERARVHTLNCLGRGGNSKRVLVFKKSGHLFRCITKQLFHCVAHDFRYRSVEQTLAESSLSLSLSLDLS